jgi:tRNA(Ile)-lysidine synthase
LQIRTNINEGDSRVLLEKMRRFNAEYNLWRPGDKLVLAVSAGVDSMSLLDLLGQLAPEQGLELIAAHVNHGLRAAADEEQAFVEALCAERHIPCHSCRLHPAELAGASWENQARQARYRFFFQLLAAEKADAIVTAHHQNDVAETMLLHLIRGSGLKGLRGILPRSGPLRRPLLCTDKADLRAYAARRDLRFYEDESNLDLRFVRNAVRHQLLPEITRHNPRIVPALNQLADIIRQEYTAVEELIDRYWQDYARRISAGSWVLQTEPVLKLPPAFQRRLLVRALREAAGEGSWSRRDVDTLRAFLTAPGSGKRLHLKKGLIVSKIYDTMVLNVPVPGQASEKLEKTGIEDEGNPAVPPFYAVMPAVPGEIFLPSGVAYTLHLGDWSAGNSLPPGLALDADQAQWPLTVRDRQAGDRFRPGGLQGSKKISDCLGEAKIPLEQRSNYPVLTGADGKIYGILGLRRADESVTVTRDTKHLAWFDG